MKTFKLIPTNIDAHLFIGEDDKKTMEEFIEHELGIEEATLYLADITDRNSIIHECLHVIKFVMNLINAPDEEEFFAYLGAKFINDVLTYCEALEQK